MWLIFDKEAYDQGGQDTILRGRIEGRGLCPKEGEKGKDCEFGKVFQVGRIVGNFLVRCLYQSFH